MLKYEILKVFKYFAKRVNIIWGRHGQNRGWHLKLVKWNRSVFSLLLKENVVEELEDKERRRSSNLVSFTLDEFEGDNYVDVDLVKDMIRKNPDKAPSIRIIKLSRRRQGHV